MLREFIKKNYESQADADKHNGYVEYGYGQVEPNHLSAQRTGQIYAQLPANANIDVLEQGQFVKYDYAASNGGEVNFTGLGEWMLVYNEIKLYREGQMDCEFALRKDDYNARIYSPYDWEQAEADKQAIFLNGKDAAGNTSITITDSQNVSHTYQYDDVTAKPDPYELHYNEDPFHFLGNYKERRMPAGTKMVPRVFKTNVGDIFTTNMVKEKTLALGETLTPGASDGILVKVSGDDAAAAPMLWQVVRVYTLADNQPAVKIMRIK